MSFITKRLSLAIYELKEGKPVAIPTETVYGLAAMINKPNAVRAIFELKERPMNHPLIVHVAKDWDLYQLVEDIPEYAKALIEQFWPGPLTLVFRVQQDKINPLINGGQSTVAIRCPSHPLAQKLLNRLETPIVAPSANPFGKISPTTAQHVKQSFHNKNVLILDGGRCSIGIESTIIDASNPSGYQILRHGLIDEKAIASAISARSLSTESTIRVPGKLESHYQPQKKLYYFEQYETLARFATKREGDVYVIASQQPENLDSMYFHLLADNPDKAAYDLYYQLRIADASNAICIAIELPPNTSEWQGIRERILKAGFPYSK